MYMRKKVNSLTTKIKDRERKWFAISNIFRKDLYSPNNVISSGLYVFNISRRFSISVTLTWEPFPGFPRGPLLPGDPFLPGIPGRPRRPGKPGGPVLPRWPRGPGCPGGPWGPEREPQSNVSVSNWKLSATYWPILDRHSTYTLLICRPIRRSRMLFGLIFTDLSYRQVFQFHWLHHRRPEEKNFPDHTIISYCKSIIYKFGKK